MAIRKGEARTLGFAPETTLAAAVRAEEVAERITALAAMAAMVVESTEELVFCVDDYQGFSDRVLARKVLQSNPHLQVFLFAFFSLN